MTLNVFKVGHCDNEEGADEEAETYKENYCDYRTLRSGNSQENEDDCEKEDPLNQHRTATCETCLQSVIPDYPVLSENQERARSAGNEIFSVAPGENKHPVSTMTDNCCEELAFPVLFPKGRFAYKMDRKQKLTPVKYFNARLLHYSGRFAMNPEYLFFAQFIIEQKKKV